MTTETSSTAAPLRAAIVGAGLISDIHLSGVQRVDGVEIVGIADTDRVRATRKAAQYGVSATFDTLDALLSATHPDVVHILTPPWSHADLCVQAMEGGAHVYVEKPMAVTVDDCDRMIAAASRTGRELCVGHCLVFDPLTQRALDLLASGEVGEVLHAAATYCFDPSRIPGFDQRWYRKLPGKAVEDLASHPASLLLRVLGTPANVVGATDRRAAHRGREMSALIEAEGGSGSMLVSLGARPEEVSLDIHASGATLRLNYSTMTMVVQRETKLPRKLAHGIRNYATALQLSVQTATSTARFLAKRVDTTKGIHSLIAAFYQALAAGQPAPVRGAEGRDVVRMLRALWPESAGQMPRRWVMTSDEDAARTTGAASDASEVRDGATVARGRARTELASRNGRRTALVTGATGFIGRHLVRTLTERGVHVRALARNPERARSLLGPDVEVVIGDFGDPEVIDGLAEGMDLVFHLASVMRGPWDDFERVDVGGGRRLIDESIRAGVQRFIFPSTLGAYALGELSDGAVVTEEMIDDPERVGAYARAKLLVEHMVMDAHRAGSLEGVIVRPGVVFGPGTSPYLPHMPHLGTRVGDRYVVFGDGRVCPPLTYVGNTVQAMWLCATSPDAPGHTFTLVDDELPTQREFVGELAKLTGQPLQVRAIPKPVAFMVGLGVEGLAGIARKTPPTTRRLLLGKTVKLTFDCSRAKDVLGWVPEVRWREGLRAAVEHDAKQRERSAPTAHAPTTDARDSRAAV